VFSDLLTGCPVRGLELNSLLPNGYHLFASEQAPLVSARPLFAMRTAFLHQIDGSAL
jgi:hypothetical protein